MFGASVVDVSVYNVCRYPEEGKFKLPRGTQEASSLSKVWITALKNLGYFGCLSIKGIIFFEFPT